jgi:hypothetical protein
VDIAGCGFVAAKARMRAVPNIGRVIALPTRLLPRFLRVLPGTSCLLMSALILVPVSMRTLLWGFTPSGLLSDLMMGSLLCLMLQRCRVPYLLLALLIWAVAQSASVELVEAVGRMPEPDDLSCLLNPEFLVQSTEGGGLTQPVYLYTLLALALITAWPALHKQVINPLPKKLWALPVTLLALHTFAMQSDYAAEPWKQYNILHKLAAEKIWQSFSTEDNQEAELWAHTQRKYLDEADLNGKPLLAKTGSAHNVLIITLEGIPGAYIEQIRKARGYVWDQNPMPLLSRFAHEQKAMHTADYVLHNHQTIRGLYSMLCGDYPKLDGSTPKALEMLASSSNHSRYCLPAQLAAHGFSTHFLQAADLTFMSKDRVMPHIGFQTVCGDNCITLKKKNDFTWGLDDKNFFEGALGYVQELREKPEPWMLTLLTVGTHQPYDAPKSYKEKFPDAKMAAVAYLDESVTQFLVELKKQGVMEDTLVIVTSDESHGIDALRLASAWGLSLIFAPERDRLPDFKQGTYGHVDLATSVLDYFGLPATGVMGRSQFRDYALGRDMFSYTNGFLRYLHANGRFHECHFQNGCRDYQQNAFISPLEKDSHVSEDKTASRMQALATLLDQSLSLSSDQQDFLFAKEDKRKLKSNAGNAWTDNLIGAQYLEFASGTRTHVSLRIKALKTDKHGAHLQLLLKEFDHDSDAVAPQLPLLRKGESLAIEFSLDNPLGRRAFSFHLLGTGKGEIQIDEFRVSVRKLPGSAIALTLPDTDL